MREWLVIESAYKNCVFASDDTKNQKGYIPRDVVEPLLGRVIEDGRCTWFTREEGELMRAHPEWSDTEPPINAGVAERQQPRPLTEHGSADVGGPDHHPAPTS